MLHDRVVVVTGASSGIGEALTRQLARDGATVVFAARRREMLDRIARDLRTEGATVLPVPCDVTDPAQAAELIGTAIHHFGRLDVLINNAGRGHLSSVEDTTDAMIRDMFALNTFALWYTTRPALRHMKERGRGHIINVASIAGKLGFPFNSAYVAAKYACVGFTHALRMELAETGIHATVVCPGSVKTEWAQVTEGGPMLPLFSESGPIVKRIAQERGIELPSIEGVIAADRVAEQIVACIDHPVAEVYTHRGSKEFTVAAAADREAAEHRQLPIVLGERAVYEARKNRT